MKKVIGVIPARWGSTRLPGKSLVNLCGKPLVQWVYERARQAQTLGEIIVATDDDRIYQAVKKFGGNAVMTRSDHPSGTDRIAEAVTKSAADIVINIQGDEPLIDPKLIDRLGEVMLNEKEWDMATAASLITNDKDSNNPAIVKVVWDQNGRALYFSRSVIPYVRDQDRTQHWRHIGIYAYRRAYLEQLVKTPPCALEQAEKLEQLRALYIGCSMNVVQTNEVGPGVDTPEDVAKAEIALRKAGLV